MLDWGWRGVVHYTRAYYRTRSFGRSLNAVELGPDEAWDFVRGGRELSYVWFLC